METKASIYKRTKDSMYNLKMKASRQFLSEVDNKYGMMPFTMRLYIYVTSLLRNPVLFYITLIYLYLNNI